MYITLYFIVTRLRDSLRAVRDHFLALDPTYLIVDLLKQHLLAVETSVVAVGAARGTPHTPFFEGCSPSPLAPSYASAAAVDILGAEDVGAAFALSGKRCSSKGKGGESGGGDSGGGGGGSNGGGGGGGGGGSGGSGGGSGGFVGGGGGSGWGGGSGGSGSGGSRGEAIQRGGDHAGKTWGKFHSQHRCFSRLDDAWRADFGDEAECPRWAELLRSGVHIFALDFDAILAAMYAFSVSAEGDCYRCVPHDPGIEAAALGASESALPGTALAEALHTLTLDSGASRCFFRDGTTLTPLSAPVPVRLADPSGGPVLARSSTVFPCPARVLIYTCTRTGRHLATFTRRPGSSLYTLTTEPPQEAVSAKVSASSPVAPRCSCRLLPHQTLLWSLPPLLPSPNPQCLPCVEGRERAAPHSSSFPPTTAPLQTLHMDVWGPTRVSGQDRERYFLLVVDDYTRHTKVFLLRSKGEVLHLLIPWIRAVRLKLRERFCEDLPVLRLHSDRGGEFSSDLLQDFCRGEGILLLFMLLASPQQNGVAERHIGLVMEVARTSMIHAAAPHFLWPSAARKVGDASVFRVWGSRAFVCDPSVDKLSSRAIPCVFLGFPSDVPGWQFYHPTSRRVLPSQDVMFNQSFPYYRSCSLRCVSGRPTPRDCPCQGHYRLSAARGAASGGASSRGVASGGAEPAGPSASTGGPASASPRLSPRQEPLSPQQLREWFSQRTRLRSGAAGAGGSAAGGNGAGGAGAVSLGGAGVIAGAGGTGGDVAAGRGGARTRGTRAARAGGVGGAGAGDPGDGDPRARGTGTGAGGDGAGDPGARGAGAGGTDA
ncbi:unnamed protein product [Closterium sp. NIES-54]